MGTMMGTMMGAVIDQLPVSLLRTPELAAHGPFNNLLPLNLGYECPGSKYDHLPGLRVEEGE
jgi:hypothetical protein